MEQQLIYEIQAGPYWDWKVALDLFLGGTGVGAFIFAVGLHEAFGARYRRITQTAALLAPLLVIAGLGLLLLKLGRPFHMVLTFTSFAPTSPLWWGGIFQTVFIVGSVLFARGWMRPEPNPGRRMLGRLLTPVAIIVGGYHGLLLAVINARPLWNTGPTVLAAMLSFLTTGIAAVMLIHLIRMKIAGRLKDEEHVATFLDSMRPTRNILFGGLVLQLGTFFLWWLSLSFGSLQGQQALAAANASYGHMYWWLGIGMGLIAPLILGAITAWRGEAAHRSLEVSMIFVTSALILIGGCFFRIAVVLGGQADLLAPTLS
ncbi:MAG: NrfD/PsrC family molybdoenzyme membrane anchor subunit [Planctomycetota bacterium]